MQPDLASLAVAKNLLDINGLRFGYDNKPVLRDVNLRIDAGEVFVLLGPNGAGKTTLVKLICGRYRAVGGQLRLLGGPVRQARHAIGLAPQDIALYPHLTARENLCAFARLAGVPRADAVDAADRALRTAELSRHADEPVARLSGGYRRRANIAAAVAHRPRLLILDEPTAGVDADARHAIQRAIRSLAAGGIGVLLITHDLTHAEPLADRVGFLVDGRIEPQGSSADLLRRYFGDDRELEVRLAHPPDDLQRDRLRELGLNATADELLWLRRSFADTAGAEALGKALESSGLIVQELCVRRPNLASLYRRLTRAAEAGR